MDAFETQMFIGGGNDAISCKMFAGTLVEVALNGSKDPSKEFLTNKKKEVGLGDMFDVQQGQQQSLKSYLDQFNKTTVLVEELDENLSIKAFIKGL